MLLYNSMNTCMKPIPNSTRRKQGIQPNDCANKGTLLYLTSTSCYYPTFHSPFAPTEEY
jgi:hypothetical protein